MKQMSETINEDNFKCGICHEIIVDPTTLTCGHTMCRFCVASWWYNSQKCTCPECRQVWHGFPQINFTLRWVFFILSQINVLITLEIAKIWQQFLISLLRFIEIEILLMYKSRKLHCCFLLKIHRLLFFTISCYRTVLEILTLTAAAWHGSPVIFLAVLPRCQKKSTKLYISDVDYFGRFVPKISKSWFPYLLKARYFDLTFQVFSYFIYPADV